MHMQAVNNIDSERIRPIQMTVCILQESRVAKEQLIKTKEELSRAEDQIGGHFYRVTVTFKGFAYF